MVYVIILLIRNTDCAVFSFPFCRDKHNFKRWPKCRPMNKVVSLSSNQLELSLCVQYKMSDILILKAKQSN